METRLRTERASSRYADLDLWPTHDAVMAMLEAQLSAAAAVRPQVAALAAAAEAAAERLRGAEGRLVYVGAGTSGRVAVQDGVELGPTFDWPQDRLVFLLAGGLEATLRSAEGAEDDDAAAEAAVQEAAVGPRDVMIAVAASGRTPYTLAALRAGRAAGALSIALASNAGAPLLAAAEHPILLDTGVEVIAGSTRMKAGTAQKIALNLFSTAIMIRLGRTYGGLMVAMRTSNAKLSRRAVGIVAQASGADPAQAEAALAAADGDIRLAVLLARGVGRAKAQDLLRHADGDLRAALDALPPQASPKG